MSKKLSFVFDKKSGDMLAPQFVPSHVSAIRNYIALTDSDKDVILSKFPEDFELVTLDFYYPSEDVEESRIESTSFVDIVRVKEKGDENGG